MLRILRIISLYARINAKILTSQDADILIDINQLIKKYRTLRRKGN
jgi:hypothetical protein